MDIMKKNPKGGRPPKSASEKLKERLTVKMAAADYYALRGKARAAGLTWAEYARTALSRSVVRQRLTAEQMTLLRQLAGMGKASKPHPRRNFAGCARRSIRSATISISSPEKPTPPDMFRQRRSAQL